MCHSTSSRKPGLPVSVPLCLSSFRDQEWGQRALTAISTNPRLGEEDAVHMPSILKQHSTPGQITVIFEECKTKFKSGLESQFFSSNQQNTWDFSVRNEYLHKIKQKARVSFPFLCLGQLCIKHCSCSLASKTPGHQAVIHWKLVSVESLNSCSQQAAAH